MSWQNISEFFSQVFTGMTLTDSIILLVALLGAYLIGWLFTRMYYQRKIKDQRIEIIEKDKMITELKIKQDSLVSELELKTADLQKTELELREIEREKIVLIADRDELVDKEKKLQEENRRLLKEVQIKSNEEKINIEFIDDEGGISTDTNGQSTDSGQLQNIISKTEIRITELEQRILQLEKQEQELIIINEEDFDLTEEFAEEEGNFFAEARVEEAKKIINKALGDQILKAEPFEKDDLKKINGIGPFIEEKLNELGIFTYKQVSQFDLPFIQSLTEAIQFFPGRIERDDWVGQAKKLMD